MARGNSGSTRGRGNLFATKKIARGGLLDGDARRKQCDEEATIYVWKESNVVGLPRWMSSEKFATGHAALKLSRFDRGRNKNALVDYISWGGAGEQGEEDADELVRRLRYLHGATPGETGFAQAAAELWGLLGKETIEALQARKVAYNFVGVGTFAEVATHLWAALGDRVKKALRAAGALDNFANLDAIRKGKPLRSELGFSSREQNPSFSERVGRVPHEEIQVLLRLQFLREANSDSEEFKQLAKAVWASLDDKVRRDLLHRGVAEDFTNLDEIAVQRRADQKLFSWSSYERAPEDGGLYQINPRLEELYRDPFLLSQQTGCCGFAAAIMACCVLDKRVGEQGSFLFELIDAIWSGNQFRQMKAFKGDAQTLADPGCIKTRLERRLSVFPPTVLSFQSKYILDYFLTVGLLMYFKSHLKVANPELLERCLAYSDHFFDERTGLDKFTANETKLKQVERGQVSIARWPFMSMKKGDLAMPIEVVPELLKLCGLEGKYQLVRKDGRHADPKKVPADVKDKALCAIVGLGDPRDRMKRFSDLDGQEHRIQHWVLWEPTTDKYWTWGMSTTLRLLTSMQLKQHQETDKLRQWLGIAPTESQGKLSARGFATPLATIYVLPMDEQSEQQLIEQRTSGAMNRMFKGFDRSKVRPFEQQVVKRSLMRSQQQIRRKEVRMTFPSIRDRNLSLMLASKTSVAPEMLQLGRYSLADQLALYKDLQVGKRPYAKLYLPCSAFPAPFKLTEQREQRTPWGLSIDAMRFAMRPYRAGLHPYVLNSFKHNCIGAVWVTLAAGLADVLSAFKPPGGAVRNFQHSEPLMALVRALAKAFRPSTDEDMLFATLVPSDVIGAGEKLLTDLATLDQRQLLLDEVAYEHRVAVAKMLEDADLGGVGWRAMLGSSVQWRALSKASSIRPPTKKAIDTQMLAYDKNERAIRQANPPAGERLLAVEAKWETVAQRTRGYRKRLEKLQAEMITIAGEYRALHRDRGAARQKELFDRHQALVKKRDELTAEQRGFLLGSGSALAEYYKELANHEAVRRSRARLLITLNKAIHGYVRGARSRNRKRPGRRFLASLLLGQAVSWRFAELTHENLSIECHGANDHGFVLSGAEMTPGINTLLTADRDG